MIRGAAPVPSKARAMHVAVDAHNLLTDRRGIGVYLRAVLSRTLMREDVRVTLLLKDIFPHRFRNALAVEIACDGLQAQPDRFSIATKVPRDADVVWHPWNGTFFQANAIPAVVTIHDVAPFAFPAAEERLRQSQQEPFVRSAHATHIITDSEFSRNEIVRYLGIEASRISVVPLAADDRFTPFRNSVPGLVRTPYILYVGANDERKNLTTLAAAHRAAFPDGSVALVCVTRNAPEDAIEFHDVSFNDLRELYQGAIALAMPSIYEGFGIPPLEAMLCGTPVIAARAASLPEVCGDAALYIDAPLDVNAWTHALQHIAHDTLHNANDPNSLHARLRTRGLSQAKNFSWTQTTNKTLQILEAQGRHVEGPPQ